MNDGESDIWSDDLFDREADANDLLLYIQSAYRAGAFAGEERSQVIAVDAEYGIGKTFFLKRLARQISARHPVAYLDTWADDFVGEPIVSLAATLKTAFQPSSAPDAVKSGWEKFSSRAGKIAWIGTKGLGKQALKLIITGGAVQGIEAVWDGVDEDVVGDVKNAVGEVVSEASSKDEDSVSAADSGSYLDERIQEYETAKGARALLRQSLSDLATEAASSGKQLPVYIIIDELDRCRPDYAIKVLEEIKHLFNVPEVYFVIGMNSDQLASSISHEYGAEFDGTKYLDRFVDRTFRLPFPGLERLVQAIYPKVIEGVNRELWFPSTTLENSRNNLTSTQWIAFLLRHYAISPRGVFKFFDRLRTALALSTYKVVAMNYLCQLIAEEIAGAERSYGPAWRMYIPGGFGGSGEWFEGDKLFKAMKNALTLSRDEMNRYLQSDIPLNGVIWEFVGNQQEPGAESYHRILERLSRFVDLEDDKSANAEH